MNKIIVFDYNGFICPHNFEDEATVNHWREILQLSSDELSDKDLRKNIDKAYSTGRVLTNLEINRNDDMKHLSTVLLTLGGECSAADVTRLYKSLNDYYRNMVMDQALIEKIYKLAGDNRVYLFANVNQYSEVALYSNIDCSMFDEVFTSLRLHKRTTDLEFFYKAQSAIKAPLKDILFVTADKKHYDVACDFGWSAVLASGDSYKIIDSLLSDGGVKNE